MIDCPVCGKNYEPVLGKRNPNMLIQKQFPRAQDWEREQLVSGVCSDECWDNLFGEERDE